MDCVLSSWTAKTGCSKTCRGGEQTWTRTVITPASNGGRAFASNREEVRSCNTAGCPVDCVLSSWSPVTTCSVTCGGGEQTWIRTVVTPASNGGRACEDKMVDIRACNTAGCPVDCILSPWLPSTNCSAPCGGGQQTWRRNITTPASNGGQECQESREEARGCNVCPCSRTTDHCPVHCALSPWIPITTCSLTCGGGQQNWTRYVVTPASNGGRACDEARDEVRSCNTAACPVPVDCVLSPWSAITACSSTCGGGNHTWIRTVLTEASSGGTLCDSKRFEVRSCNNEECPEENDSGKNWYESSMTTFCKRLYNFR